MARANNLSGGGRGALRFAPALTLALLLGPVLAGLGGSLAPAFGYLPALGGERLSLTPWRDLLATPGLGLSIWLSVWTGLLATSLSLALTALICAAFAGTRVFRLIERVLSPLLSAPHAAAAFGLAFLLAPSGWIARGLSPWLTGWTRPPDLLTTQDPWGLALTAGLVIKEVPFLLLMTIAALGQIRAAQTVLAARMLGYGRASAWLRTVFPQIYPQIRLPVYAVLAYSLSVVDVALILGPTTPAPLAVRVTAWMADPDLGMWFKAAAGASLQTALALGALALWRLGEIAIGALFRARVARGGRGPHDGPVRALAGMAALGLAGAAGLGLLGLLVWSAAAFWRFPDVLPAAWTLKSWGAALAQIERPMGNTLTLAAATAGAAAILALLCLESERRGGRRPGARALWLLYVPLIIPQIGFLFGLRVLLTLAGWEGTWAAVALAHLAFVLPYVFLSLADPWRAHDPQFDIAARSLGARPWRVFAQVRAPMLLAPILTAAAVGFAVSAGQYLPTLLIGAGRVTTVTTEAVALASGGDRRSIGVWSLLQMGPPLLGFALALAIPALAFRNRRGLRGRA